MQGSLLLLLFPAHPRAGEIPRRSLPDPAWGCGEWLHKVLRSAAVKGRGPAPPPSMFPLQYCSRCWKEGTSLPPPPPPLSLAKSCTPCGYLLKPPAGAEQEQPWGSLQPWSAGGGRYVLIPCTQRQALLERGREEWESKGGGCAWRGHTKSSGKESYLFQGLQKVPGSSHMAQSSHVDAICNLPCGTSGISCTPLF